MAFNKKFLGRGLSYPLRLGPDGSFLKDVESTTIIQSSIAIIMLTRPGERVWQPEFGSYLYSLKHEPNAPETWELVKTEVFRAINRWEPRIRNLTIRVEPEPRDRFILNIYISYNVIQTNTTENFVFPFYLAPSSQG